MTAALFCSGLYLGGALGCLLAGSIALGTGLLRASGAALLKLCGLAVFWPAFALFVPFAGALELLGSLAQPQRFHDDHSPGEP